MKRKLIILIVVFFIALIGLASCISANYLSDSIELVSLNQGSLSQCIEVIGQVDCDIAYQFFDGYLSELYVSKADKVSKDDKLLQYYDSYGKKQILYARYEGIIEQISDNCISFYSGDYYLLADLPIEMYQQIAVNDKAFFYLNEVCYQCSVIEKKPLVKQLNGKDYYQIKLSLPVSDVLLKQSLLVKLYLTQKSGQLIDKRAVYQTGEGSFLILEDFSFDLSRLEKYLVRIEVLAESDGVCLINSTLKEGQKVCVVDRALLEVIGGD
ncbi:MAG: hypothetical protein ACI4WG_03375 [Erysipelotrichaceae bacterium]